MKRRKLIPCIFIAKGKAVKWFDDNSVLSDDVVALAEKYCESGADELIVLDLSKADDDHEEAIDILKKITRAVRVPVTAGGNIRRLEDVKKILYAGAKRAIVNLSRPSGLTMIEDAAKRFGKEKVAVSLNDFDRLFKQQKLIESYSSEIIFMHRPDIDSVVNITDIPTVILTDVLEEKEATTLIATLQPNKYNFKDFMFKVREKNIQVILILENDKIKELKDALFLWIYDIVFDPFDLDEVCSKITNPNPFSKISTYIKELQELEN